MSAEGTVFAFAPEHPALSGHFPGHPIVPGVLLLDEVLYRLDAAAEHWRLYAVKFHRPVLPGQALSLEWSVQGDGRIGFELRRAGTLVIQGTLERHGRAAAAGAA